MTPTTIQALEHYQANSKRVSQALDIALRAGKDTIRRRDKNLQFTLQ
jgi:hypothetical protein